MSQSDFVSRGQALVAAGQFQEAVKVCRLGLLGRPTTVEGRVVLGQALLALKRYDEVLAEMRVALELDHSSIAAQILKAEALLRKGDTAAAIEALHAVRQVAPGEPRILQLLGEAESASARPSASIVHPAVGFVGSGETKNYPNHLASPDGIEDSGPESYTKPTSLQAPASLRRSSQRQAAAMPEPTPPPAVLAVGDRSGTVEVDPELEGVELDDDLDFDDLAAPPPATAKPGAMASGRGSVKSSRSKPSTLAGKKSSRQRAAVAPRDLVAPRDSTGELSLEDVEELSETRLPKKAGPGPGTAVRNAVAMPSGPIDAPRAKPGTAPPPGGAPLPAPMRGKPGTQQPLAGSPMQMRPAAGLPAQPPGAMASGTPLAPPTSLPLGGPGMPLGGPGVPPAPLPPAPRAPLAAALPTVAAAQPPYAPPQPVNPYAQTVAPFAAQPAYPQQPAPYPPYPGAPVASPQSMAAAARPTLAIQPPLSAAQQQSAAAVDALFGNEGSPPAWAMATALPQNGIDPRSLAASQEPTARPEALDPSLVALMNNGGPAAMEYPVHTPGKGAMKTGVRKGRSKLQIALWILIGAVVIGGGVFAGFQIRAIRLQKQIRNARDHATELAKSDTWSGWTAARDSLAGIVQASNTVDNRAALARARALLAFEFGDGLPEARAAVEQLGGQGGLDGDIAGAYVALTTGDTKGAKLAADAAIAAAPNDPGALYVMGQTALMLGDTSGAVKFAKQAYDKQPRAAYGVGLARAYAAAYAWDDAIATLDKVLAAAQDHPGASIERGLVVVDAGRIAPTAPLGTEVRAQLERIVAEGRRPLGEQQHGVSPSQVAAGYIALAHVDFARGDVNSARGDMASAAGIGLDDQRFAEDAVETLYLIGDMVAARNVGDRAVSEFPNSKRARIALAQIEIAQGKPGDAIDLLTKQTDVAALPFALAVRGQAKLAAGDHDGARGDFDNALKKLPNLEPAIVGTAWLDLADGNLVEAQKLVVPRISAQGSSAALTTVYAAILRRSPDAADREKAKTLLDKIVAGPPSLDVARAQLELARLSRDAGDFHGAHLAYGEASRTGSFEARFETALFLIEDADPQGGRDTLDSLLKEAGDHPSPDLVLETARARMLVGDHAGAAQLLDEAGKMQGVPPWKLDRERGRLAMRKGDFAGALKALAAAIETSGDDAETFLLAADIASADDKGTLGKKLEKLAPERLKNRPEALIVSGKLLIGQGKNADAQKAYAAAKEALKAQKASPRRVAQADFGLAVIAYNDQNDVQALNLLELVMREDPSIYDAYLFMADITKDKKLAFDHAQKAVALNPDYAHAWLVVGKLAAKAGDRKMLADAIGKLQAIAPGGEELKELQSLR